MSTIPRLTDATFAEATGGSPVLVTFSAPTKCPKCPLQVPAMEQAIRERGIPVYHVDVEKEDSAATAQARPAYLGTPKNKDGTKGTPRMVPDFRVPAHYVYANGRPIAILTGITDVEDLEGLYEHGSRVASLGILGRPLWL
jgi:thioredoxin-like negative regulator of GroEL